MSETKYRQPSLTRTEYPPIRPGDKPKGVNSKPNASNALAEKSANSLNISAKSKTVLQTKPTLKNDDLIAQLKQTVQNAKLKAQSKPTVRTNEPKVPSAPTKSLVKRDGTQTQAVLKNSEAKAPTTSAAQKDQPRLQTQTTGRDTEPKIPPAPSKKRPSTSKYNGSATKKAKVEGLPNTEPSHSAPEQPTERPSTKKPKVDKASTEKKTKSAPQKPIENPKTFLEVAVPTHPTTGEIPIYDTCSTIRQKISALLGKDNSKPENGVPGQFKKDGTPKPYTQAQFLRDVDGGSAGSLKTFMAAKKLMGGAENPIYPCAYEFFEKKRIWEGGKKTSGRKKVEEE
jgi:hypothetical protein